MRTTFFTIVFICIIASFNATAQVLCIECHTQNDSIHFAGPNLLLNGGFENGCNIGGNFVPNASSYSCDITNWTCTGGGSSTYAHIINNGSLSNIVEGTKGVYFGNYYCTGLCSSTSSDTSCLRDTNCAVTGVPAGFPMNTSNFGNGNGVRISQTVSGLTVGGFYILEFWAGGEYGSWPQQGLFAVNVGFGDTMLRNNPTQTFTGIGIRFVIEFRATSTSHTISFCNWGHICSNCTELVLDDAQLHAAIDSNIVSSFTSTASATSNTGCAPFSVTFTNTSTGASNYLWYFGDGSTSQAVNPTYTYTHAGTDTVTLVCFNGSNCGSACAVSSIIIHVDTVASPVITGTPAFCPGGSTTLNAGTFAQYHWSTGSTLQSINVSTAGTYTVTVTEASGCSGTASQAVTIYQSPTPVITADSVICSGDSTVMDAGAYSQYHWSSGGSNQTINAGNAGTYYVTVTDAHGCTGTALKYLAVIPRAQALFVADTLTGCTPMTIHLLNSSTNAIGYHWDMGNSNTSTLTNPSVTYNATGTYTVTLIAFGANGCNDTLTRTNYITILTLPVVSGSFIQDTLVGCNPLTVHFTNTTNNGVNYKWLFGDGDSSFVPSPTHIYHDSGTFTVTLISINPSFCGTVIDTVVEQRLIRVDQPIKVTSLFDAQPRRGCAPLEVKFTNNSTNATTYDWISNSALWGHFKDTTITFDTGTFHIYLVAANFTNRCPNPPDSMEITIDVANCELYIPNVFTPNNDKINDAFHLVAEGYTYYHLIIFDRWGLKVFESNDHNVLWNGKINNSGGDAPDGTYYYIFSATDFFDVPYLNKGFLTLIR